MPSAQSMKYIVLVFGILYAIQATQLHSRLAIRDEYLYDKDSLNEDDLGIKDGREINQNLTQGSGTSGSGSTVQKSTASKTTHPVRANSNVYGEATSESHSDVEERHQEAVFSGEETTSIGDTVASTVSTKPKLVLHVGPRKTATTTIQYNILRKRKYKKRLEEDNFVYIDYEWSSGLKLVEICSQVKVSATSSSSPSSLPEADIQDCTTTKEWNEFVSLLDDAYKNKQNAIVSNEALSLIQVNEAVKAMFLTLTKKWDVRVIVTYRPLETWYPSLYFELRTQNIYNKEYRWYRSWPTAKDEGVHGCDQPITEWFAKHWKKVYLGDPLQTLETYKEIFGANKVKILTVVGGSSSSSRTGPGNHGGGSGDTDITEQFLCEGLEAKHTCSYAQRAGPPAAINTSEEKKKMNYNVILYEHDLLAVSAYKLGLLDDITDECKTGREVRDRHATIIQEYMEERGVKVADLPQNCVSRELMNELEHDSWLVELNLAPRPRSQEEFKRSMAKMRESGGTYCDIDVSVILSDMEWRNFFVNDMRFCQPEATDDDDYYPDGESR